MKVCGEYLTIAALLLFATVLPYSNIYADIITDEVLELDCRNPQTCEEIRDCNELPSYYCDCERGVRVTTGLDTVINEPMWFRTSFTNFTDGFLVYWYGKDTVLVEAYPFCSFDSASITHKVYPNGSYYFSAEEIAALVGGAGSVFEHVDVRIHVGPTGIDSLGNPMQFDEFSGRAACFTGVEGAVSTCDNPLLLTKYGNIAFDDSVTYRMDVTTSFWRPGVLRYRNPKDMSEHVELSLTYGECYGDTVDRYVFVDSIRPYFFPLELLNRAYEEQQPIYVHLKKPKTRYLAHLYYRPSYRLYKQELDTTICIGKGLVLPDTTLYESTVFKDTVYGVTFKTDTLYARTIRLNFSEAIRQERTVNVKPNKLPYLYGMTRLYEYGDYEFTSHKEGECDVITTLHLRPVYTVRNHEQDTTLCRGKVMTFGWDRLWQDGELNDTVYSGVYLDTMDITTYKAHFSEAEMELEYDTIAVHADMLPYNYYGARISSVNDTTVLTRMLGECARQVQLKVIESENALAVVREERDTLICSAEGLALADTLLTETTVYIDTICYADTLVRIDTWNITALPRVDTRKDTIALTK